MRRLSTGLLAVSLCVACKTEKPATPAPSSQAKPGPSPSAAALVALPGSTPADNAVRTAQAEVKTLPKESAAWVKLAEAWVKKARDAQSESIYDRAEVAANQALELDPTSAGARRVLALVHRNAHRFKAMRDVAQALVKSNPKNPDAWGLLGDAELELGHYDAAAAAYEKMMDGAPALPAFVRVAWLRWLNGDVDGALELWEEALKTGPRAPETKAWVLSEAGHVFWFKGDLKSAELSYEGALAVKADHAPSLFGRARVRWANGKLDDAITDLEASVAARRAEPVYAWLAVLLREAGRKTEAAKVARLLARPGDFDDPRSAALYLASNGGDANLAVELARRDLKARGDIFSHDAMAFTLLRAGKIDEAKGHADAALRLGTPDPRIWAHAGLVSAAAKDPETARTRLKKALSLNPRFDPQLVGEVQDKLKQLETP